MKKITLLLVSVLALLSFCFSSCEKNTGDALKGTWKYVPGYNLSSTGAAEELEMTIFFDGKGNFKWTVISYEKKVTEGIYKINGNFVYLFYTQTNGEGVTKDYKTVMEMDSASNPKTLTFNVYDSSGNLLTIEAFEKQ